MFYFLKSIKDVGLSDDCASYPLDDLDLSLVKRDNPLGDDYLDLLEYLRNPPNDCLYVDRDDCTPLYDTPPLFVEDPNELPNSCDESNCNSFDVGDDMFQSGDSCYGKKGGTHEKCATSSLEYLMHDNVLEVLASSSAILSEDFIDEVVLCGSFLYNLFAYDDVRSGVRHTLYAGVDLFQMEGDVCPFVDFIIESCNLWLHT